MKLYKQFYHFSATLIFRTDIPYYGNSQRCYEFRINPELHRSVLGRYTVYENV